MTMHATGAGCRSEVVPVDRLVSLEKLSVWKVFPWHRLIVRDGSKLLREIMSITGLELEGE